MKTIITSLLLSLALTSSGQVEIPKCDTIDIPNIADQEKKSRAANGQYKKCIEDDLFQIGTYKGGVLDGPIIKYIQNECSDEECYHSQGSHIFKETGNYLNGQKDGEWIATGNFEKIISNYKEGKLNGEYTVYSGECYNTHSSESISLQGYYLNGLKSGKWFYDEGEIQKIAHYKKGILHGEYLKFWCCDSSNPIDQGIYQNGKKEGNWFKGVGPDNFDTYNGEKSLPVYRDGKIVSYREPELTTWEIEERWKFVFKIVIMIIILIIIATRFAWKKNFRLITNFFNRSKSILHSVFNSKTLPVISLGLNIISCLALYLMPATRSTDLVLKLFLGILLLVPLTLSIISVSIKNKNGRITLSILGIIGALQFLIPHFF